MQFVHSIQNQNLINIEIIIVDDSSIDNSVSIIKGLMKEDPRIILLTNKENKGRYILKQEVY
jgi:glycosyltransferase involved in cell wall biosynthesis